MAWAKALDLGLGLDLRLGWVWTVSGPVLELDLSKVSDLGHSPSLGQDEGLR